MKNKFIWILNITLFAAIVFMGVDQAGKGAEIAHMEKEIKTLTEAKNNISEQILLTASSDKIELKASDLGFVKPTAILYVDSQDVLTSNIVQ